MTDKKHMLSVSDKSSRRIDLGSTNIVMDFAARNYIELNGLERLQKKFIGSFEKLLMKQFLLIQQDEIGIRDRNPASKYIRSCKELSKSDYMEALKYGIVTADIKKTSPALRYLACNGQTAPLHSKDGIAFEVILQHHLDRFSNAIYVLGSKGETSNYLCARYNLVQAVPPAATKGDNALSTENLVMEELDKRYGAENQESLDSSEIAGRTAGYDEFDLIMRQCINNAQGPDVMVLSKRKDDHLFLDLYQAKHYSTLPSAYSQQIRSAFASLGVSYDGKTSFDTEPKIGSAAYTKSGAKKLLTDLEEAFGEKVEIRNRVVVFSSPKGALQTDSWQKFPWEIASEKKVWIWSREMLEPTISALSTWQPST
jgi:hypothetical protein